MYFETLDDYLEAEEKLAPLHYMCLECGKEYDIDQRQCGDTCGGRVVPVYERDEDEFD